MTLQRTAWFMFEARKLPAPPGAHEIKDALYEFGCLVSDRAVEDEMLVDPASIPGMFAEACAKAAAHHHRLSDSAYATCYDMVRSFAEGGGHEAEVDTTLEGARTT